MSTIEEEIKISKAKNWAKIIAENANYICDIRKNDLDLFIDILNGEIYAQAQEMFAQQLKDGKYDGMLMPVEYNK